MPNLVMYEDDAVKKLMVPYLSDWVFSRQPIQANAGVVARWGNEDAPERYPQTLNRVETTRTARDGTTFQRIMALSGIPTPQRAAYDSKPPWLVDAPSVRLYYQAGVFDLSVVFFREYASPSGTGGGLRGNETRRLKEFAIRAVYALGLDFGVAYVGLEHRTREPVVIGVDPAPSVAPNTAFRFAGGLQRYASAMNAVAARTRSGLVLGIGADPEFSLAKAAGGRVFASDYLPLAGPVGCEMQPAHSNGRSHKPLAELRPQYALNPVRLFQNLRRTVDRANQMIPAGIVWQAGSVPDGTFPTGGHIHFSRIPLTSRLLRALDNYLTVPLFLLEDPARAMVRRPRYGFLGDVRVKSHGGFEYRTPFSWLTNPVLARGTLCLAYVVAREHLHLTQDLFVDTQYIEAFYTADKGPFRRRVNELWADLERTATYHLYHRSLVGLRELISSGWLVDESADFRTVW